MGGSPAGQRAFFFPPAGESAGSPQHPSRTTKARTGARTQVQSPISGSRGQARPASARYQVLVPKCPGRTFPRGRSRRFPRSPQVGILPQ